MLKIRQCHLSVTVRRTEKQKCVASQHIRGYMSASAMNGQSIIPNSCLMILATEENKTAVSLTHHYLEIHCQHVCMGLF